MELSFEHRVNAPLDGVFRFHSNPANLAVLMEPGSTFRVVRHEGNILPGAETWVEQTVGWCIPITLGFRHSVYEPPLRFGEELIRGPFAQFQHIHEFEAAGSATIVRDKLTIRLARRFGGEWATLLFVRPIVRRAFSSRYQRLDQLARVGSLR